MRGTLLLTGVVMLGFGVWALVDPPSFATAVAFPEHRHFLHDLGAFQIGIGVGLLAALVVGDPVVVVLAAFLVANTLHTVNHVVDLPLGGHGRDAVVLGGLSLLSAAALAVRVRQRTRR